MATIRPLATVKAPRSDRAGKRTMTPGAPLTMTRSARAAVSCWGAKFGYRPYSHSIVATAGLFGAIFLPTFAVFAVALREVVGRSEHSRFLATVGLVAAIVELGLLMTMLAGQAALVEAVGVGEDPRALFRFWDVLYNSLTYAPEATFVAAFGFATHGASRFPRWIRGLSLVTAALLAINVRAIWIGIPDPLTLPSAVFLIAWFTAASVGLARSARVSVPMLASQPASA